MSSAFNLKPTFLTGRYERISLTEPFDFQRHKDNFPYYTEVVILPDGEIKYAAPSHALALAELAGVSLSDCPGEYFFSTLDWLLSLTGALAVWWDYYRGNPNEKQLSVLSSMKDYGIYGGSLLPTV